MALADEIAAAADLVKGKLTGIPVAVVRGLRLPDDGSTGRDLLRAGTEDLFWLGTAEAIELGRRQVPLRRSVRRTAAAPVAPELIEAACADALTAPAPHHSRPVRFLWLRAARRAAVLAALTERWRADLRGDDPSAESVQARVARGQILYDAPEVLIPFTVPGARTTIRRRAQRRRADHVHRRRGRGRAGPAGGAGRPRGGQLLDRLDDLRPRCGARRVGAAAGLGHRWAPSPSDIRRIPTR